MTALTDLTKISSRLWKNWGSSVGLYAVATGIVTIYVTDWRVIATRIPYYGKKFDEEDKTL